MRYARGMEIRHLRAVAALADELHFGRAARRLAVTQPALSQQVSQLEHLLDTALFIRQPRVEPTAAGRALAVHARRILAAVDEAESEARSLGYRARRRIRLGYLEYWNPPFLAAAVVTAARARLARAADALSPLPVAAGATPVFVGIPDTSPASPTGAEDIPVESVSHGFDMAWIRVD